MLPPLVSKCHHVRWMSVDKARKCFSASRTPPPTLLCVPKNTEANQVACKDKEQMLYMGDYIEDPSTFFLFCYVWLGVWSVCDAGPEINTRFFFLSTFACQDVRMSFNRGEKLVKSRWAVWALVCSLLSPLFLLTRKLSCVCVCNNVPACAHLSRRLPVDPLKVSKDLLS